VWLLDRRSRSGPSDLGLQNSSFVGVRFLTDTITLSIRALFHNALSGSEAIYPIPLALLSRRIRSRNRPLIL
jgi:hypothetical protein